MEWLGQNAVGVIGLCAFGFGIFAMEAGRFLIKQANKDLQKAIEHEKEVLRLLTTLTPKDKK